MSPVVGFSSYADVILQGKGKIDLGIIDDIECYTHPNDYTCIDNFYYLRYVIFYSPS